MKLLKSLKKILKYISIFIFTVVIFWIIYFLLIGNFHQVDKNIYRSAQLFSFNMPYYLSSNKIKSILNLRGESSKDWYKNEIKISKDYNITHYNYGISARKMIKYEQMEDIINIIKKAPKPLLIHCKAGADRTSLAVALYLNTIKKDKKAKDAISILYGHFPWIGSKTFTIDESFNNYVKRKEK